MATLAALALAAPAALHADTLLVPSEYPTIQAGIDASLDGDEVVVADGTYTGDGNRDIDFLGKAITVRSQSGNPDACIIDCEHSERGFRFDSGENSDSVVAGFTITNGYVYHDGDVLVGLGGAGVFCFDSSPTITNCIFTGNISRGGWSGVSGGAICCAVSSNPTLTNCIFSDNVVLFGWGGAIGSIHNSNPTLTNCTITGNTGSGVHLGDVGSSSSVTLSNCILWGNTPSEVVFDDVFASVTININYCNVQGGWDGEGNIDIDPGFAFADDLHLTADSPCIDVGTNDPSGGLPPTDIDGTPRPLDGDDNGVVLADMGAYEFNPDVPTIALTPSTFELVAEEGGPNPEQVVLLLRNAGGNTLDWEVNSDAEWLSPVPLSGDSQGEVDEVMLAVDASGLEHSEYRAVLEVSALGASNTPRFVRVTLYITREFHVPGEYGTIQAAVDAATVKYDQVVVADGTYTGDGNRDIDFLGRGITVRSESGDPDACIIDCQGSAADPHRGFYLHSGETNAVVNGFTITNGYAQFGGGVYAGYYSSIHAKIAKCTITNCKITNCHATGCGGGIIHSNSLGEITISNCEFTGNTAGWEGGGVDVAGRRTVIEHCIFTNNAVTDDDIGGGGLLVGGPNLTMTDCTFTGNTTNGMGGGIYVGLCSGVFSDCVITDCHAGVYGGGIWAESESPRLRIPGTFDLNWRNCVISDNTTSGGGGGISGQYHVGTWTNCTITGNESEWFGGGVDIAFVDSPVYAAQFIDCTIAGNKTNGFGGGLRIWTCQATLLMNCLIFGNTAVMDGGGLEIDDDFSTEIVNCTLAGNVAGTWGGAVSAYGAADLDIVNSTLAGNTASVGKGVGCDSYMHAYPSIVEIDNSILWNGGSEIANLDGSTITVTYSDVWGGWTGTGNIDEDPLFADPGNGDYHIAAGSPCIDAADNDAVPPDTFDLDGNGDTEEPIPFDFDGNPRFVDDPNTTDTGNGTPPIVDMGAYELLVNIPGDLNGDGCVDQADLGILLAAYELTGDGDCDGDGDTDQADLSILLANYGAGCP